jgi:hypothetical protein
MLKVGEPALPPNQTQYFFDLRQVETSRVNLVGEGSDFTETILL